jgi:transposase
MSTSLLYHGFGIHGYRYVRTQYEGGAVIFIINQDPSEYRCSKCRSSRVLRKGQITRRFRALPIGRKPVFVILAIQRVLCLACGLVRQVQPRFADSRRSYTRAFERYALELSRHMTIKDVARHLGVNWGTIKSIQKRNLKRRFSRPKLGKLKQIAIDEISIGKRHRYLTVVLDLKTGAVVYVGEGKGGEALTPFFKRLKRSKAKVEAVAMDMSPAYIRALEDHLPGAAIVFDHFHVVKLYNEKLSDLRRQLFHQATQTEKAVLKGTRWLLLKNPENLDEGRDEQKRLQQALDLNRPLAAAYYMKEDLRRLWSFSDKKSAFKFLKDWIYRAGSSGISMLRKFAETLARHHEGILAYYDYPISTAPLEGTNNKIKTMKRQAYGYRDLEFFKLKIMAAHEARYALVG